ncbi:MULTISPECIES: hypothetical protein [unclassified Streptomyces]|uniref:hypothetical protein n=1 Tax=unclassified Streptomyces TaxID=2593676 RepID=UPI002364FFDC|nr:MULTISPECIES: hypothetical protein [unclassified Streptomyces]MDF3141502.1 hypothetical protein [Streptomyces sp. T21Q-yed]WDF45017.1 hypothetical protein PBV52_50860 [Streptomyces sp. T12]
MTTEEVRKNWGNLLTEIRARVRGAIVLRRYRTEVAVLVPVDWYRQAVDAIGQPTTLIDPSKTE